MGGCRYLWSCVQHYWKFNGALLPEKLHFAEKNGIFNYQTFALSSESPLGGGTEEQCE